MPAPCRPQHPGTPDSCYVIVRGCENLPVQVGTITLPDTALFGSDRPPVTVRAIARAEADRFEAAFFGLHPTLKQSLLAVKNSDPLKGEDPRTCTILDLSVEDLSAARGKVDAPEPDHPPRPPLYWFLLHAEVFGVPLERRIWVGPREGSSPTGH